MSSKSLASTSYFVPHMVEGANMSLLASFVRALVLPMRENKALASNHLLKSPPLNGILWVRFQRRTLGRHIQNPGKRSDLQPPGGFCGFLSHKAAPSGFKCMHVL